MTPTTFPMTLAPSAPSFRRRPTREMSSVRVLVGTKKGAFILTSDGKRQRWEVSGPLFWGVGDLPCEGLAGRSETAVCVANERLVRASDSALQRRRQDARAGALRSSRLAAARRTN